MRKNKIVKDIINIIRKVEGEKNPFDHLEEFSEEEKEVYSQAYLRIVWVMFHKYDLEGYIKKENAKFKDFFNRTP